jgi:hypothetical protein
VYVCVVGDAAVFEGGGPDIGEANAFGVCEEEGEDSVLLCV